MASFEFPTRGDGTFSMRPDTADGHCTLAQLLGIAELTVKCNVPSVKPMGTIASTSSAS